jgi:hypothetical protein
MVVITTMPGGSDCFEIGVFSPARHIGALIQIMSSQAPQSRPRRFRLRSAQASVAEALDTKTRSRLSGLPVIDDAGTWVGVVRS